MKRKSLLIAGASIIVAAALGCWVSSRWNAWFHNPPEEPYTPSAVPSRVLLSFGNEGELSRYVSWMCDTVVDASSRLMYVDVTDTLSASRDTVSIGAVGEVFQSRSGKAAYYRAQLTGLKPYHTYRYAVESRGVKSAWYSFRTYDPSASDFTFLYMGDVQDTIGGVANTLLRRALAAHPEAEFVAFGGDLIERPTDAYFGETFRSIDSVCTAMPVVNITGNHDYLKYLKRKCERRFALVFPYFLKGMEERDDDNHLFALTYHNTDFYLLDSDRGAVFLWQQRRWLKSQIEASRSAHKIVMIHHPLYSVKRKNNNLVQRLMFNSVVQDAGVDLVLQGHEHAYARCTAADRPLKGSECHDRPLYTVSHCSPKNYNIHPTERFYPVLSGSRYYQLVTVSAKSVTMKGYDANSGALIDSVVIRK
ncbi:MAG: metallophosphoesterase [Bacteroidaceae bacterium]|nr:metallophosphoesterase [Bacteroidaceae bacterium]